ncbi:ArsR/SmtB family transcription factor [Metabacillus idriensis]|uniref:ArsR/SmtB family transcription factor n=1 Tax=Metabacillus idriensis TaxID=324768 RepID=UPI003D2B302B
MEQTIKKEPFARYEKKFKALADQKRLEILQLICRHQTVCVGDLSEMINMPQSKLSYHLKILLDAEVIFIESKGTWSYYSFNKNEMNQLLSEELCGLFKSRCIEEK